MKIQLDILTMSAGLLVISTKAAGRIERSPPMEPENRLLAPQDKE